MVIGPSLFSVLRRLLSDRRERLSDVAGNCFVCVRLREYLSEGRDNIEDAVAGRKRGHYRTMAYSTGYRAMCYRTLGGGVIGLRLLIVIGPCVFGLSEPNER